MSLKILTYNLHKGFSTLGASFKLDKMREALLKEEADIVFLQEVQGEHHRHKYRIKDWPLEPQVDYLGADYWRFYAYGKNAIYKQGDHGNAILSKFPLLEWENIAITSNRFSQRSLLHAKIKGLKNQKSVHLICVHLGLLEAEREKQFGLLSQRIASHVPEDEPLIIAGDFNDWRRRAEIHLVKSLNLQDAFLELQGKHPKTFPAIYPLLAVDRIYYRGLNLLHCECLRDKKWKRGLSDHLPLTATFDFL
jgi:endonuclease/exonuclease/phosphatase family metal-dependent hydrolase